MLNRATGRINKVQMQQWNISRNSGVIIFLLLTLLQSSFILLVTSTSTTAYLYYNHTRDSWRVSTSRVGGDWHDGEGCWSVAGNEKIAKESDSSSTIDPTSSKSCSGYIASATYSPTLLETGWDSLHIRTQPSFSDQQQAFSAGYLEGYLTWTRIHALYQTIMQRKTKEEWKRVKEWIGEHEKHLKKMVEEKSAGATGDETASAGDTNSISTTNTTTTTTASTTRITYSYHLHLILRQLSGLLLGYNTRASYNKQLTLTDLWILNSDGDLMDVDRSIEAKLEADAERRKKKSRGESEEEDKTGKGFTSKHDHSFMAHEHSVISSSSSSSLSAPLSSHHTPLTSMSSSSLLTYISFHGHCSAMIKLTTDDLIISHNTWSDYDMFLRIYKSYNFSFHHPAVKAQSFQMTSYPGYLWSSDDFMVTQTKNDGGLIILETTLTLLNETLLLSITPQTGVMAWIRVLIASRLAETGEEWVQWFTRENSGTYNCAWMIIDTALVQKARDAKQKDESSKFGRPNLLPNTFTYIEQLPLYTQSSDLTPRLQSRLFFASYNLPYYQEVADRAMYTTFAEKMKDETDGLEYKRAVRGKIYSKSHAQIKTLDDMKKLVRRNDYKSKASLIYGCPSSAISARYDLLWFNTSILPPPHNRPSKCDVITQRMNGAIDAKVILASRPKEMHLIAGPTYSQEDGIAPFDFASPLITREARMRFRSEGAPRRYDFEWRLFSPQGLHQELEKKDSPNHINVEKIKEEVTPALLAQRHARWMKAKLARKRKYP